MQSLTSKVTTGVAALAIGAVGATVTYAALDDDPAPQAAETRTTSAEVPAEPVADAVAAEPDPADPFAGGLEGLLAQLPPELRTDLEQLQGLDDPAELRGALEDLGTSALSGDYGPMIEAQVKALRAQLQQAVAELPPAFVTDLEALRGLERPEQVRDALGDIQDKALGGAYGPEVRQQAEQLTAGLEAFGLGDLLD